MSAHPLAARVEEHRLDNGLSILLLCDPTAPVIAYQTWYRVGSRHEHEGRTGIAHLFEHLMFNQTEHLQAGDFDRLMEAAGGETNAATWVDWTYYKDNLPASRLELAVRLEADRMQHLTLTDAQVESEREVVMNERRFRVEDDVEGFLSEELFRLAFTRHPYHWPTIGWMRDIAAITPDDARAFYRTFYAPNNATVVLVGDFEPRAALAEISRHYGAIPAAEVPETRVPAEPPQDGERRTEAQKPVPADRLLLAWKAPAQGDADFIPLQVAHELLLGGPSARLHRRLVIETEITSSVTGMLAPFRDPGLFEVYAPLMRGRTAEEADGVIAAEVARLAKEPPAAAELDKARNRLETELWTDLETAEGKAEALGHYHSVLGDWRRLFEVEGRIAAVGPDDVAGAAARWLRPETRTVVIARPSGEAEEEDEA